MISRCRVAVLVPVFNRWKVTRACVKQLLELNFEESQIFLIDDSSPDETPVKLQREFSEIQVLKGDGNQFWSGSLNLGLREVVRSGSYDFVLIVNDDLRFAPDFFEHLISAFSDSGPRTLVGSVALLQDGDGVSFVRSAGSRRTIRGVGHSVTGREYEGLKGEISSGVLEVESLSGHALFFAVTLLEDVGYFDTVRFRQYFGDTDFSLRAHLKGYRVICCLKSVVFDDNKLTGMKLTQCSLSPRDLKRLLFSWTSPYKLSSVTYFYFSYFPLPMAFFLFVKIYLKVVVYVGLRNLLPSAVFRACFYKNANMKEW